MKARKMYVCPSTMVMQVLSENLLLDASPGVGGDYDPSKPIDAKPNDFVLDDADDLGDDNVYSMPKQNSVWVD